MARVHETVRQSSEVVFLNRASNVDELCLRFFILCIHSPAGGLPLAVFIISDETEATITMGLNLVKESLPNTAFYGKGLDIWPQSKVYSLLEWCFVISTDTCWDWFQCTYVLITAQKNL